MADGPKLWTVAGLAAEFQKDRRTIAKRLEAIEPAVDGRIRKWLMRDAAPAILGIDALDPTREKAELDATRRRKLEIEIDLMEGRSLNASEVLDTVANMNSRTRARLLSVAASQAGRANPDNPKRAEQAFLEGIYEALTELADDPFGSGPAVATAPKTNGQRVGRRESKAKSGVERGAGEVAH